MTLTDFVWTPVSPTVGEMVYFTGTATGTLPITYSWMLDVGGWKEGPVVTYTYTLPGTYSVTLTATNCGGSSATAVHSIVVVAPPEERYTIFLPLVSRGP